MKKTAILGLGVAFSLALVGTSFAKHTSTSAGQAANGLNRSRHNLSTSGSHFNMRNASAGNGANSASRANVLTGSSEMCAICHTPHFADRASGPLWNRALQSGTNVSGYGTTIAKNIDAEESNAANMFSTLACLSCHDGVTAFSSVINRPGKSTGSATSVITDTDFGWRFNDTALTPYSLNVEDSQRITSQRLRIGGKGKSNTVGGLDLSDDHPIGVIYRGQGDIGASASLRARTVKISEVNIDVAREVESEGAIPALVTGNLWAVKGFISNTASIQDLLRSGSGQGSGNYVQCSSCHDLHYKNNTNPEAFFVRTYADATNDIAVTGDHEAGPIDGLFLRRVGGNSDSGLCRTCHYKQ